MEKISDDTAAQGLDQKFQRQQGLQLCLLLPPDNERKQSTSDRATSSADTKLLQGINQSHIDISRSPHSLCWIVIHNIVTAKNCLFSSVHIHVLQWLIWQLMAKDYCQDLPQLETQELAQNAHFRHPESEKETNPKRQNSLKRQRRGAIETACPGKRRTKLKQTTHAIQTQALCWLLRVYKQFNNNKVDK